MPINNRKLLLICNPGVPGVNHVPSVPAVLQRYKNYFQSAVGGYWRDDEIIEEEVGYNDEAELTWLFCKLGEITRNADYSMIVFVGHGGSSDENNDQIQLSKGKLVPVSSFLAPEGFEGSMKRTIIIDACRTLIEAPQQQILLEQRTYSAGGMLEADWCKNLYNEVIDNCDPHVELIQSTQYGQDAHANETGTAFSDAFFGVLGSNIPRWNNQALGLNTGRLSKSTIDLFPSIAAAMQADHQVPQIRRYGNGGGEFPIYAVWRAVER